MEISGFLLFRILVIHSLWGFPKDDIIYPNMTGDNTVEGRPGKIWHNLLSYPNQKAMLINFYENNQV